MAKKGAKSSGGARAREKTRNQAMAATLPPSPATWRKRAWEPPYHNNKGTTHAKPK
jgi:hypothetical protein